MGLLFPVGRTTFAKQSVLSHIFRTHIHASVRSGKLIPKAGYTVFGKGFVIKIGVREVKAYIYHAYYHAFAAISFGEIRSGVYLVRADANDDGIHLKLRCGRGLDSRHRLLR